ncbi:MAG: acyl-CoA dehydrogenase C-terminal domain-containing protein [Syntrophomonas sp.]|nr:acyl-CoA dehydrogenase C-terminal domain-containing protein [Syntrophomonas sp.]
MGDDHFDANFYKGKIASAKFYIMNHVTDVFGFEKSMKGADKSAIDIAEASFI